MKIKYSGRLAIILMVICAFAWQPVPYTLYAQEKEQEKTQKEEKKEEKKKQRVITDEDLKQFHKDKPKSSSKKKKKSSTASSTPKKKPTTSVQKKKVDPKKTEKYWRDRKDVLEKRLNDAKEKLKEIKEQLDIVHKKYIIESRPLEYRKLEEDYYKLKSSLDNYTRGIASMEAQMEALHDEARREGVPPGWLR